MEYLRLSDFYQYILLPSTAKSIFIITLVDRHFIVNLKNEKQKFCSLLPKIEDCMKFLIIFFYYYFKLSSNFNIIKQKALCGL